MLGLLACGIEGVASSTSISAQGGKKPAETREACVCLPKANSAQPLMLCRCPASKAFPPTCSGLFPFQPRKSSWHWHQKLQEMRRNFSPQIAVAESCPGDKRENLGTDDQMVDCRTPLYMAGALLFR